MDEEAPGALFEGNWYTCTEMSLGLTFEGAIRSGLSGTYILNLSSKSKEAEVEEGRTHILCEQLFLSDWGPGLEHKETKLAIRTSGRCGLFGRLILFQPVLCVAVKWVTRSLRQKNPEFEFILGYIMSSSPAWAT